MRTVKKIFLFSIICFFVFGIYLSSKSIIPGGAVAISNGKGKVSLFWFPPDAVWSEGGFRIQDNKGKVWVKQILPLKQINKISTLSNADKKWLRELLKDSTALYGRNPKAKQYPPALIMKTAISPGFSKALGLTHTFKKVSRGELFFKIIGLNKNGKHTGMVLKCKAVNGYKVSPLPSGPKEFFARTSPQGVKLYWNSKSGKNNDIVYFVIERQTKKNKFIRISSQPLFIGISKKKPLETPYFVDRLAPQKRDVEYRIYGVDLFGRHSKFVNFKVFVPSFKNLLPPDKIKTDSVSKGIMIKWNSNKHSSLTKFIIERSNSIKGPFKAITMKGIRYSNKGYLDRKLIAGGTYYYRLRTIMSDGSLSSPSKISGVIAFKNNNPPKINSLKYCLGINTVLLSWKAENRGVAGYLIERKVEKVWQRLNKSIQAENSFKYRYLADHKLEMSFRVRSVGINNKVGPPGKIVIVRINKVPKGKPEILSIKQIDKGIEIKFDFPRKRQDIQYIIRRSGKAYQEGMIISPLLSYNRKIFIDKEIVPGQIYWYQIQVVGPQNWISKFSKAKYIKTIIFKIPIPSKPDAELKKKPFTHVHLTFLKVNNNLKIIVERRVKGNLYWLSLNGEGNNGKFIDANPPKTGRLEYRIRYKTVNGIIGPCSDSVFAN
jgi:hypothetical protein